MLLPGNELGLGEAYLYDDFDIEGDIESLFKLADVLSASATGVASRLRLGSNALRLPRSKRRSNLQRGPAQLSGERHSIERDRQAIAYHYNVSNDFYALWLDRRMVYSCAYFTSRDEELDRAQEQKLEHICRKLRLKPGQRLLDIGCGWGGLVIYAAERYGVETLGITLSRPQANLANERIKEIGLADRSRVELLDYREIDEVEGFDALASIGMFEHVGEARLETYFQQAWRLLRPGGLFLNHG
ncbi:MAG: class I SAM-dependent methyltransferase, partial [Nitrospiraceae bacterium]